MKFQEHFDTPEFWHGSFTHVQASPILSSDHKILPKLTIFSVGVCLFLLVASPLYEDARRGGLGNSSLFPTGTPPRFFKYKFPILTCIKIERKKSQSLHVSKSLTTRANIKKPGLFFDISQQKKPQKSPTPPCAATTRGGVIIPPMRSTGSCRQYREGL